MVMTDSDDQGVSSCDEGRSDDDDEGISGSSVDLFEGTTKLGNNSAGVKRSITDEDKIEVPCKKRSMKTEDDHTPLPDPYPLPKYYRADIEKALATGQLTKEVRSSFLSAVASSMLVFKRFPSRDDYVCVARTIIKKYPFLSSPAGTPYVSNFC